MIAAVLLPLAACSDDADDLASTGTDLARAERVWQDPWAAPTELAVPTFGYGSNGHVVRLAGTRETAYTGAPRAAALRETRAALAGGWSLYAAICSPHTVRAQVVRGDTLDDRALVTVEATRKPGAAFSTVRVVALVPHHADGSWPVDAAATTPRDTCLAGGPQGELATLPDEPTEGDAAEDGASGVGWDRDRLTDGDRALVDEVAQDPWLASVDADLAPPSLRTGDSRRFGTFASGTVPAAEVGGTGGNQDAGQDVAAVVADMRDWELTWASCTTGTAAATLRLAGPDGLAVAHLQSSPATGRGVAWTVHLPMPEGPDANWVATTPALADSRCLDGSPPPRRLVVEGQPVGVPVRLQPIG